MIDRGFAVVNEGTNTIRDIMSFPRLYQVSLTMDDDGQGRVRVRLTSGDAPDDLVFTPRWISPPSPRRDSARPPLSAASAAPCGTAETR